MRWVLVLGWLLVAGHGQAEAPMDLDSPFEKTVLVRERTGEIIEKIVGRGRINGALVELEKQEGGILLLPSENLLAVLPRLPAPGVAYRQSDAQGALKVLQQAQNQFGTRPEVSPEVLAAWEKLASVPSQEDEVAAAALQDWLARCGRLPPEATSEEIQKLKNEGAEFLTKLSGRAKEIELELMELRDLGAIQLQQSDPTMYKLGSLGEKFVAGAVLWALLGVPFIVMLTAFSDAVRSFRERRPLAGVLRLMIGGLGLGFLLALLMGVQSGEKPPLAQTPSSLAGSRRAVWYSLNTQEKWASQGPKKVAIPAADWAAFLGEKIVVGDGADSLPFWHLAKPEIEKKQNEIFFYQPIQVSFIKILLSFVFAAPQPGQSWTDLELVGASLGRFPLGAGVGQMIWERLHPSYQPLADKLGLTSGVRWLAGEGDLVIVATPATATVTTTAIQKSKPTAKESVSARELAEVFDQGFGEIYFGKVITVEGALVEVSSQREILGTGTKLKKQDSMDEFILEGLPEGPNRKYALRVRCQFKSSEAYFLDSKGDLFRSAPAQQNPSTDIPILRRFDGTTKIRVSAGRVESSQTETRLITLYDCRKVEGFDGKDWVPIWGN